MRLFVKFSVLWILLPFAVIAQSKRDISRIDSVKNIFIQLYNRGNSDAIYKMKEANPYLIGILPVWQVVAPFVLPYMIC